MMSDKGVGALLVLSQERLEGIISERDYARKVILRDRSSKQTQVRDIMDTAVLTVTPRDSVEECMRLMTEHRTRHLPVVDRDRVIGIISIGDLVNWIITAHEETIGQLQSYIAGNARCGDYRCSLYEKIGSDGRLHGVRNRRTFRSPLRRRWTAALEEDFRIARSALETGHAGIYRYTPKPELDKDFDAIAKQITQPMTPMEFYRILTPIVGDIKCGHTAVNPPRDVQRAMTTAIPIFPLDVEILSGKVYVSRDYSPDVLGVNGLEIRRINGVAIDKILATMMTTVSGDGDSQTAGPLLLGRDMNFARRLYSVLGIESPFLVEFRDPTSGKARELRVAGLLVSDMQKVAIARYHQDRNPDSAANLKFLEDGNIAVLTIYEQYDTVPVN